MKLNLQTYRDKVHACWIGKNIGGTMGAPYEGWREFLDVKGFITEKDVVLPNDDLDLQLVWLHAVEMRGAKAINEQLLGEFWLSFVTPHWAEYGLCKNNMKMGIHPPLCGDAFTTWKDSNGAWIRTEIWACLAPASPEIATKYAYCDGCVDHGANGEGTVAAVFFAALESAAFVVSDIRKLLELGLTFIPENSRVAQSVRTVMKCYDEDTDYETARNIILKMNADIGDGWFEAPSNVAYAVIGLLYGEGDFKKSMICAINCGDDTDCTAATVGSILGIMGGTAALPEDWREHIGDGISTMSIALGTLRVLPQNCSELTDRVERVAYGMLYDNRAKVALSETPSEIPDGVYTDMLNVAKRTNYFDRPSYAYTIDFMHTRATVMLPSDPKIGPLQTLKFKIRFAQNRDILGEGESAPYFLRLRWWLPEGFAVKGERTLLLPQHNRHTDGTVEAEFEIVAPETLEPLNRLVLEVTAEGRLTVGYVPITLLG